MESNVVPKLDLSGIHKSRLEKSINYPAEGVPCQGRPDHPHSPMSPLHLKENVPVDHENTKYANRRRTRR